MITKQMFETRWFGRRAAGRTLGLGLAVLAAGAAVTIAAFASPAGAAVKGYFGGGDEGVQSAVSAGGSVAAASSTEAGITLSITGFSADTTRTVVGLQIAGHPEYGEAAMPMGMAQLVDQDGRIYREVSGSADQQDPRLVTRVFPPLDPGSTRVELQVNGLQFLDRVDAGETPSFHPVDAQWRLAIPVPAIVAPANVNVDHAARDFGSGTLALDAVSLAASQLVISGHLSGYTSDELAALLLRPSLTDDSGRAVAFVGMRTGFGPGRQSVEIRYAPVSGPVHLEVVPYVDGSGADASVVAKLSASLEGATAASWDITLP